MLARCMLSVQHSQDLTLVDLPGITQVKAGSQSDAVPATTQRIVKKYMEGELSSLLLPGLLSAELNLSKSSMLLILRLLPR